MQWIQYVMQFYFQGATLFLISGSKTCVDKVVLGFKVFLSCRRLTLLA